MRGKREYRPGRVVRTNGLVLLELLVVIVVVVVLYMLFATGFTHQRASAPRIKCSSNLKQIALSYKMYAGDHDGRMPWHELIPGSPNIVQTAAAHPPTWRYFLAISNELGATRLLTCPADTQRYPQAADAFSGTPNSLILRHKRNEAVSYFVGPYAGETRPWALLAGDRHITPDGTANLYGSPGNLPASVNTNQTAWWIAQKKEFHNGAGNYALADGSVQQASTDRLRGALKLARDAYGTNANRFLFPQ